MYAFGHVMECRSEKAPQLNVYSTSDLRQPQGQWIQIPGEHQGGTSAG